MLPPVAAKLIVVESTLFDTLTLVALVAVTVSVEDWPAPTDVGLAAIVTVGAAGGVGVLLPPPQPVRKAARDNANTITLAERIEDPVFVEKLPRAGIPLYFNL